MHTLLWLTEWLSIAQKRVEQYIIGQYTFAMVTGSMLLMRKLPGILCMILILLWMGPVSWMVSMHRTPDSVRMRQLFDIRYLVMRLVALVLYVGLAQMEITVRPVHLGEVFYAVGYVSNILMIYITTLPSSGNPGEKRKLALSKVKELFGTDWVVNPEPMPQ